MFPLDLIADLADPKREDSRLIIHVITSVNNPTTLPQRYRQTHNTIEAIPCFKAVGIAQ